MYQTLASLLGLILLPIGLVLTPSPIPIGLPLLALGVFLLLAHNRGAVRVARWLRQRVDWIDRGFTFLERHSRGGIRRTFARSRPDREEPR